jgi:hypothetical protein
MEQGGQLEHELVCNVHPGRRPDQHHLRHAKRRGVADLDRVKTKRGGDVQVRIDMVHVMKSPQQRNAVIRPVPPVKRPVKQQEGDTELDRQRQIRHGQQAELLLRRQHQQAVHRRTDGERGRGQHECGDDCIHPHPRPQVAARRPERKTPLDQEQPQVGGRDGGRKKPQWLQRAHAAGSSRCTIDRFTILDGFDNPDVLDRHWFHVAMDSCRESPDRPACQAQGSPWRPLLHIAARR